MKRNDLKKSILRQILLLAERLIAIRSDPDNAIALEQALDLTLMHLSEFTIERFESHGTKSALIYSGKKRPEKFLVLLNGHLDVIPGKKHQYIPKVKGSRLYGVGAMDMKANLACMIAAFKEVAPSVDYPLALQLVTDEETGGFHGTKFQVDKGVRADFIIAGETTQFHICHGARGVLLLRITCKGKTAHGAYPWKGENAVVKMSSFVQMLDAKFSSQRNPTDGTTVNISNIETSNRSFNKIPDDCSVLLDVRYVPEDSETIINQLRELLPRGFTMKVLVKEPAVFTPKNNMYVKLLKKKTEAVLHRRVNLYRAHGTSDARHFHRVHCNGIEFGPKGGGIGTDDEWVSIPSLTMYYDILTEFLRSVEDISPRQSKRLLNK